MKSILHISNTDIASDSRILKELDALSTIDGVKIFVIGVPEKNDSSVDKIKDTIYLKMPLLMRVFRFMPRPIRYFFELLEFTIKTLIIGHKIRPNVIHCHDTFALPSGWLLKTFYNCKLVYDAHELESEKNGQNYILSSVTLAMERFCWAKIDLLVSVSESITEWYMRHLGYVQNLLILNSPVVGEKLVDRFLEIENVRYFHRQYGIAEDNLIFVYLGILGPGRGIELCLEAFSNGPSSAHVVFIGHGILQSKINEYSERFNNIHFHPTVPHDQVVLLVSHADYGLCMIENASLSDYYCLPNKLFEYCFARLPVLASNFPEIEKIVREFSLGECCEPSLISVSSVLNEIVTNRPIYGHKDISILSWEAQAKRLREFYECKLLIDI